MVQILETLAHAIAAESREQPSDSYIDRVCEETNLVSLYVIVGPTLASQNQHIKH